MKPRHIAIAVAVNAAWGFNFVVIAVGLDRLPPLLFSALRFGLAAFPAILLVPRPRVAWRWVVAVGLALGVAKFSLLFFGIDAGMPAGLSAVVLQSQAIFTLVFAVLLLGERPGRRQLAGVAIGAVGISIVGWQLGPQRPAGAFALVLGAGVAWGLSNVAMRKAAAPDMLAFIVWASAVAAPVLGVLTLLVDGPAADLAALRSADWVTVGALGYIAGISTLAGFGAWGALIRRYGASTVAPFSMLAPFFAMASAALLLAEPVHATDVVGGALVVTGVLVGAISWARERSGTSDPLPGRGRGTGGERRPVREPA